MGERSSESDQVETADEGQERERGGRRRTREFQVTGLADVLPDWILPPEGKQHVRAARKEMLLAARSVIDAWIERNERGMRVRRGATKIEIE